MVTNTFTQFPPSSHHHHHQRHHHYKKASYSPASLLKIFQFLKISWNSEQSLLSINLCKIFELWESCFLFHIFSLHIQDQYYILKIGKQCVSQFWLFFCYFMPELVLSMLRELPGGWLYFVLLYNTSKHVEISRDSQLSHWLSQYTPKRSRKHVAACL